MTIIDRGLVKYSGDMDGLLIDAAAHPTYVVTLRERMDAGEQLQSLPGVLSATAVEGKPAWSVSFDRELTDTNTLLRGVLDLGLPLASFNEDRKHLNQAFMDLTEQGVRT